MSARAGVRERETRRTRWCNPRLGVLCVACYCPFLSIFSDTPHTTLPPRHIPYNFGHLNCCSTQKSPLPVHAQRCCCPANPGAARQQHCSRRFLAAAVGRRRGAAPIAGDGGMQRRRAMARCRHAPATHTTAPARQWRPQPMAGAMPRTTLHEGQLWTVSWHESTCAARGEDRSKRVAWPARDADAAECGQRGAARRGPVRQCESARRGAAQRRDAVWNVRRRG